MGKNQKKKLSQSENFNHKKWHSLEDEVVFQELQSDKAGLEQEEAANRLLIYGTNALPLKKLTSIWTILFHQVKNPLIFILIAAAILSLALGDPEDAIFILIVIVLNSSLGAYQEYNVEKSVSSLQNLLNIKARVRRGNKEFELSAEDLVPGDIVLLALGYKVPADLRLLEANNLMSDESFLTGESMAAMKRTGLLPENIGIGGRVNIAYAGAIIISEREIGILVSTGINTEVGQIAEELNESVSANLLL